MGLRSKSYICFIRGGIYIPILLTIDDKILQCPKCGSDDLHADKKGYDDDMGIMGMLIFSPIGLVAGEIDSDKFIITCLECGFELLTT